MFNSDCNGLYKKWSTLEWGITKYIPIFIYETLEGSLDDFWIGVWKLGQNLFPKFRYMDLSTKFLLWVAHYSFHSGEKYYHLGKKQKLNPYSLHHVHYLTVLCYLSNNEHQMIS